MHFPAWPFGERLFHGSEGELQFRQVFGHVAGELRPEFIEVRVTMVILPSGIFDLRLGAKSPRRWRLACKHPGARLARAPRIGSDHELRD
jgi:hypothetical protein